MTGSEPVNLHATAVLLDGSGVLIRGPSGAGKSLLALALLDRSAGLGRSAALVADDRVDLSIAEGRLLMHAPLSLAGLIELRGLGILTRPHESPASLVLVVDLVDLLERMPEEGNFSTRLLGFAVPRCPVPRRALVGTLHQVLLVEEALRRTLASDWEKST